MTTSPELRGGDPRAGETFHYDGGSTGCVLIHGFLATPHEMRPLGQFLNQHDITVEGIRLPGHGTRPEDLAVTTWHDWYAHALESVRNLRAHCTQVFVGGLSLGATLSLLLAAAGEVDGVIAINTALHASDWRMRLVRFIAPFRPYTPKGLANLHDRDALAQHVDYLRIPLRATASLYQVMRKLERQLPRVNVPLLLIQSRQDAVVRPQGAQIIFERVSSTNKRIVWLERGGHIAVEDYDKDIVFNETQRFITGSA